MGGKNQWKRFRKIYRTGKHDFQQFERIRSFGDSIYTGKTNIDEREMDQTNLLEKLK